MTPCLPRGFNLVLQQLRVHVPAPLDRSIVCLSLLGLLGLLLLLLGPLLRLVCTLLLALGHAVTALAAHGARNDNRKQLAKRDVEKLTHDEVFSNVSKGAIAYPFVSGVARGDLYVTDTVTHTRRLRVPTAVKFHMRTRFRLYVNWLLESKNICCST